ncbi:MAG: hypothetical protein R3293_26575 [Candidatus Promineifilaceae bacterium]|nr:hypothetical protein [Candidatus Promineifilaceae bacterium]
MNQAATEREQLISHLNGTVSEAVLFFSSMDGDFFDGHQTARAVLSHLVFWHREYCSITQDLLKGNNLKLLKGSQALLNERAFCEYRSTSMSDLAACLTNFQKVFTTNLRCLDNWDANFPFKMGCRKTDVGGRVRTIERHIRHHLTRQQRAHQRGIDWINAYYPQEDTKHP